MTIRAGKLEKKQYWDLHFSPSRITVGQAEEQLNHLLEESVRLHMISDVPVGFLLSGGLDSTAMLGFAADKTSQPLSAYTIGFSDPNLPDERPYARLAAKRYGVKHHETTIGPAQFADFMPDYVSVMEEPVCEPPAVALYYVSKLARDYVKVLISGEGGDEAFAGYSNYRSILWIERFKRLLAPFNGSAPGTLSALGQFIHSERLQKYAPYFGARFEDYYYSRASSPFRIFNASSDLYSTDFICSLDKKSSISPVTRYLANGRGTDVLSKMLYMDTKTWLPDDLLIKADKITMANSIELRVPLLDHKVLEFAASMPSNFKVRGFTTKWIAKKALKRRIPREIVTRKKAGFPVPYESWLRNDLRDWVRGVLLDRKTLARGYFRRNQIENLLSENLRSGAYSKEIFSLIVLELWSRDFIDKKNIEAPTHSSSNVQFLAAAP
jgi:asparagine synthase (glutamine-hydrolysing)